jgi:O-antigen/teichoic acid export membrane protein
MGLFLVIPMAFALLLVALAMLAPLDRWLGLSHLPPGDSVWILVPLALQVVVALPQGLILGLYRAIGQQATSAMMANAILLLQILLSAMVLWFNGGPVLMAWLQLVPVLLVCGVAANDLQNRLPGLSIFGLRGFTMGIVKQALSPSLSFLSIQLSQLAIQQFTFLLVGRLLGPVEVVVFSTVRTVINSLRQLLGLLSHSAWPEFTRLEACGDRQMLEQLFYTVLYLSMGVAFLMIGVLALAGEPLMQLWLGVRFTYPASVVHHFSVYIVLVLYAALTSNVLMATNRHQGLARWQVISAVACVAGFWVGLIAGGVAGGVLALILAEALPACLVHAWLLARQGIGISAPRLALQGLGLSALACLAWWQPIVASALALILLVGQVAWAKRT